MAHETNSDVDTLLAAAAARTRRARAELTAAARDLSLSPHQRLTDQQRALAGDVVAKLVATIELDIRQRAGSLAPDGVADSAAGVQARLEAGGRLRDAALLQLVMRRVEEHRLALAASDARDVAADPQLLDALVRHADAELARRAIAYVVGEARRHDGFREPVLRVDDLPAALAWRLHWQVAAAVRAELLCGMALASSADIDAALEAAVRQAMADHRAGEGAHPRAARLAARLDALGELSDAFLARALAQGHVALFAAGLGARARLDESVVWPLILDRGREGLLVLLRAIGIAAPQALAIVDQLEAGLPSVVAPTARRGRLVTYEAIDPVAAERLLCGWRLDRGFREAIDDLADAQCP